jgi:hypothetical protein
MKKRDQNRHGTWNWKWPALAVLVGGGLLYLFLAPQPGRAPAPRSLERAATPGILLPPRPTGAPIPGMPTRGAGVPGMPGMPGMPQGRGRPFTIVDLNLAPLSDLMTLPGMTSDYAQKIIAGRPFRGRDDLERAGIPRDVFERMSPPAMIRYVETGVPRPTQEAAPGPPAATKP